MFISPYKQKNILNDNIHTPLGYMKENRDKAGIIDARRAIHIFYDENNPYTCKVIQINISVTKGSNILFDNTFMNRHNGSLSFIAVYTYNCKLNTTGKTLKEQFLYGELSILSARRNDRETDYDNNYTRNEYPQLYSKVFSNYRISCNLESKPLIHPKYYTQEHEYACTNDCNFNGIIDEVNNIKILGIDIVDDITKIYRQNANMFNIVDYNLNSLQDKYFSTHMDMKSADNAIKEMNYINGCDSLVNGLFVYDSQMGINFKDAIVLCKNYISKESLQLEFETFLESLETIGKCIEKNCGSIRMIYNPSLLGSKCRIIYKDMNNSTSDSGLSRNKSLSSKDSNFEVTETIGEIIDHDESIFIHDAITENINYDDDNFQKEKIISYYT